MRYALTTIALVAACCTTGCSSAEKDYAEGMDDGFATGYNTACEIRATFVRGDWNNPDYSRGYAIGQERGIAACNEDRRNGVTR